MIPVEDEVFYDLKFSLPLCCEEQLKISYWGIQKTKNLSYKISCT